MRTDENRTEQAARLDHLSEAVIGAVFRISNTLGVGFLEKVYDQALMLELARRNLQAEAQAL